MVYVDLNPIRACLAKTPEESDHTSIQQRIQASRQSSTHLFPFVGNPRKQIPQGIAFTLKDYIELVDWTGRIIRSDKRGAIPEHLPPIHNRLNQDAENWLYVKQNFESRFKKFVGAAHKIKKMCESLEYQRCVGLRTCADYFT